MNSPIVGCVHDSVVTPQRVAIDDVVYVDDDVVIPTDGIGWMEIGTTFEVG
jgi:hypothetical protein